MMQQIIGGTSCNLSFDSAVWHHQCVICRFWWYLAVQGVLITWALLDAISAWNLHPELNDSFLPGFKILLASGMLFATFLFDWGLLIFHTFLLATGRTTAEHMHRRHPAAYLQHVPKKISPFSKGLRNNIFDICCAKGPHVYRLPPRDVLVDLAQQETIWDNRYYSCCQ